MRAYLSHLSYGQVVVALSEGRYEDAIMWNQRAIRWNRWHAVPRMQYALTIEAYTEARQAIIAPVSADRANEIGRSASPNFPALLLWRFNHLYATARNPDEAAEILDRMRLYFPRRLDRALQHFETYIED